MLRPTEPVEPNIDINVFIYIKIIKEIIPTGIPNRTPSILSKIPPCPGKMFPLSFILAFLLKYENIKSPT